MESIPLKFTINTTELTKPIMEEIMEDIKPIIIAVAIIISMSTSTLGSSLGITNYATSVSLLIHKPRVPIYVYVFGAFTYSPFFLTFLSIIILRKYINVNTPLDIIIKVSSKLIAFGISNLFAGYAMGKISYHVLNMIVKDKKSTFKLYLSYSLLELIVIFGFILTLI